MSWKIRKFSTASFRCFLPSDQASWLCIDDQYYCNEGLFIIFFYFSLSPFFYKKKYMRLITVSLIPRELEGDTNIATADFFVSSPNQNGSNDKMISFLIISAVQLFDHYL